MKHGERREEIILKARLQTEVRYGDVKPVFRTVKQAKVHTTQQFIGKQGATLKRIGTMARHDIEAFFGIKANVKLWVKVKEDWRNRQGLIHTFGLD